MKISKLFLITIIAVSLNGVELSSARQVQYNATYFLGVWDIIPYGLPTGEMELILSVTSEGDTLKAVISDTAKTTVINVTNVVATGDNSLTLSWYDVNNGVDVIVRLNKKDENNLTGTIADMFTLTGKRKL